MKPTREEIKAEADRRKLADPFFDAYDFMRGIEWYAEQLEPKKKSHKELSDDMKLQVIDSMQNPDLLITRVESFLSYPASVFRPESSDKSLKEQVLKITFIKP